MDSFAKYLEEINNTYPRDKNILKKSTELFHDIAASLADDPAARAAVLDKVRELIRQQGLAYALTTLYRQQVNSGFVLGDPLTTSSKQIKLIPCQRSNVTFSMRWNPDRQLRANAKLLTSRGVVRKDVDPSQLINDGCFLCKENIAIRNPKEIPLKINLAGEVFYLGANLAYITNNHFTIINNSHRAQRYRFQILKAAGDLIDLTDGHFRTIFNGRAGASILWHEHLQATTEEFPIENINFKNNTPVYQNDNLTVHQPDYPAPLFIVEGEKREIVESVADKIITQWIEREPEHNTVNIISVKTNNTYKIYVFPRDSRKLFAQGKIGFMASFEMGGIIVLSHDPAAVDENEVNERHTFDNATIETVTKLLKDIAPKTMTIKQTGDFNAFE